MNPQCPRYLIGQHFHTRSHMSDHQLVRYKSGKHHFEVLVKPGTVPKYREGKLGFDNVILSDIIFKKYSKAERAAPSDLK